MEITSRLDFEADPKTVYLMMTDKGWLEELVSRSEATSHTIDVAGRTTRIEMSLPAPSEVARFVGSALKLNQTVEWDDAASDDSRTGRLTIQVPGMPVTMDGTARLYPGGRGTIVDYAGELKVNIPLMGKKIEQQAGPYIKDAIDAQQDAGEDWLAARS
ncbi:MULTISPECIES: DUF2505 domain-containing protein [unclassified Luteococcus]|uniref:DUF2505 domain-containing protein n=1 Tax=unclassified Luteococcus TaxID=2639923 RepID=UPI00313E0EE5